MPILGARDVSPFLVLLVFVATLGPFQFGYHLSELNAPQHAITCENDDLPTVTSALARITAKLSSTTGSVDGCKGIPMEEAAFAAVSSVFTIGGLIGALAAGPVTSKKGRWLSIQITAVTFILGAAVEALAPAAWVLGLGRFVSGLGSGASTVIVPLYISEVAPPAERGFFGAFTQISCNTGILTAQALGYFLSHGAAWRWILGISGIIAAGQVVLTFLIPESPAWLATVKGDAPAGRRVLQRIRGPRVNIDDEVALWGSGAVKASVDASEEQGLLAPPAVAAVEREEEARHIGVMEALRDPLYRPAMIVVMGVMFAQQLCGINSIVMYSVALLNGLLPLSSIVLTILVSAVNLVMTAACSPLPDKWGRKTCLLVSIIGQGCSSLVLAISIMTGFKIISALAVAFFVGFFAVGLGPVPFILASELVGQEAVGATQSWCLATNYTATYLVAQFFPIVNTALNNWLGGRGGWVYFIFAAFAAMFSLFIWSRVPETKGKRDADEVWGRTRRLD
ncbi:general substrate transporter [Cryphonectria parasitica EP155]|uniref:General substrate transporter n=1 Tax=Cryphonectria parasitica (strain ATCC 38755 / EP155) TaxID=660469 RepID=A0A9P4XXS1_CRYP1|nr:general substrate transporter [Cryphonectria parasitica EP155]KAF3762863.1 general substrate transporter [Cryphonectria parasitica EP155]